MGGLFLLYRHWGPDFEASTSDATICHVSFFEHHRVGDGDFASGFRICWRKSPWRRVRRHGAVRKQRSPAGFGRGFGRMPMCHGGNVLLAGGNVLGRWLWERNIPSCFKKLRNYHPVHGESGRSISMQGPQWPDLQEQCRFNWQTW